MSSGRVRDALVASDFGLAEQLLGRPYAMQGVIEKGQQIGRTINFPTANIVLPDTLLAVNGVYAVSVELAQVNGTSHSSTARCLQGVANVGTRPTVDGSEKRLEVHLFDFDEDIYGQTVNVLFHEKIRDEQKFASIDELKQQIGRDAQQAAAYFRA